MQSLTMQSPPSPALSLCDTLSSPDLDAYLDNLPPMSSLPSPYMNESWWKEEEESGLIRHDSFLSDIPSSSAVSADVLCAISSCNTCNTVKSLSVMVTHFLTIARMPEETVALAFNILSHPAVTAMHCWHANPDVFASGIMQQKLLQIHGPQSDASCQRALIILSALSIAVSFTEDYTKGLAHWSNQVAEGIFSTQQIGSMNRLVLAQLEWHIAPLAAPAAISAAMKSLSKRKPVPKNKTLVITPVSYDDQFRLLIGPQTTLQHGLVTPEPTPDCTLGDEGRMPYLVPA